MPSDDETNFHQVANEDHDIMENARMLEKEEQENVHMIELMDVLQCLGVEAEVACGVASSVARCKPRFQNSEPNLKRNLGLSLQSQGPLHLSWRSTDAVAC